MTKPAQAIILTAADRASFQALESTIRGSIGLAYVHEAAKRGVFAYIIEGTPEELLLDPSNEGTSSDVPRTSEEASP
jgi:hypothetical protein